MIIFFIATLILNAGLLVLINYGSFYNDLQEELETTEAYFIIPDLIYTDAVKEYFYQNEHIQRSQTHDTVWIEGDISYNGKDQFFSVLFFNMHEIRTISNWKYVGESLPPEHMSVYLPHMFRVVGGYEVGDTIELRYYNGILDENKTLSFTVKGYTEDIYFCSRDTGLVSFYLPAETYRYVCEELNPPQCQVHVVFADLDDINSAKVLESGMRERLNRQSGSAITGDATTMLLALDKVIIEMARTAVTGIVSAMMVIFAAIIVIVCMLVVRFRIINSIEEDVVKMGSMKAVGYTSRQIIYPIVLQFSLIAGVGGIFGILLTYPLLPFIAMVFERQSGLKWEQSFDAGISVFAYLAILVVVVLVAWFSARRISKLNPISALRGETSVYTHKKSRLTTEGFGSGLTLFMAFKSMFQSLKQYIMIGIILVGVSFAGAYGVVMYYNTAVDTKALAEIQGLEICNVTVVFNTEKDQSHAINTINNLPDVWKTQYLDEVKIKIESNEAGVYSEVAAFVMDSFAYRESNLIYEGRYPAESGEIAMAGILAERLHKEVGDSVRMRFGSKEGTFNIVGLTNGASMGGLNVSMLTKDFKKFNPGFIQQSLNVYLEDSKDVDEFIQDLKNMLDKEVLLRIMNFDRYVIDTMESYQSIIATMGSIMLIITLVVVALVLYFVINSSIIRRKRELGIQKAIGFTTFQLMNQLALSFMIPLMLGAFVGSLCGALYTNTLMSAAMNGLGIMRATFVIDFLWIAVFGVGIVLFSYAVALLVSWRIRKISAYMLVSE